MLSICLAVQSWFTCRKEFVFDFDFYNIRGNKIEYIQKQGYIYIISRSFKFVLLSDVLGVFSCRDIPKNYFSKCNVVLFNNVSNNSNIISCLLTYLLSLTIDQISLYKCPQNWK